MGAWPSRQIWVGAGVAVLAALGLGTPALVRAPTPQAGVDEFLHAFFARNFRVASADIAYMFTSTPPMRQDYRRIAAESRMAGSSVDALRWSVVCRPLRERCTVTFSQRWLPPMVVRYATVTTGSMRHTATHYLVEAFSWNAWIDSIP